MSLSSATTIRQCRLNLPQQIVAQMILRPIVAGIEENRTFKAEVCGVRHRSQRFVFKRKLIELSSSLGESKVSPKRPVLASFVTKFAGGIQVPPFVRQPVVSGVISSLGDPAFGPKMLHLPSSASDLGFAIGAFSMEELLQGGAAIVVTVDRFQNDVGVTFSLCGIFRVGSHSIPIVVRPNRTFVNIKAISMDMDHRDKTPEISPEGAKA